MGKAGSLGRLSTDLQQVWQCNEALVRKLIRVCSVEALSCASAQLAVFKEMTAMTLEEKSADLSWKAVLIILRN